MKTSVSKFLFMVFVAVSALLSAQITISGKVQFRNKGVKDVSVTLKDTYDGATTDSEGNYSFETSEKGSHILIFTSPQYNEIEKNIETGNENITVNAEIKERITEISTVVITAGSIEASDRKRATAALTPLDIYTTAGADAQMSTGYKFLPGVQNAGESEGLFVRGGSGNETKFFIDGNLVNNYFTSSVPGLAGRDRFNTSIFKGSVFSSGGYSALYGQALSAVMLLESVDLPDQSSYSLSVFPFAVGGDYQSLNKSKTSSYGFQAGYSNMEIFNKLIDFNTDFVNAPQGFSVNGNFRVKTGKGGFLKYYGSFDTNSLAVSQPSLELNYDEQQPKIKGTNTFHSLNFRQRFGRYTMNLGTSFSHNENDLAIGILNEGTKYGSIDILNKGTYINGKAVFERKIAAVSNIKAGFELQSAQDHFSYGSFFSEPSQRAVSNFTTALFAENNSVITKDFSTSVGVRAENASFLNEWNLSPRISAAYRISPKWVSSLAYGIFYQTPDANLLTRSFSQNFQKAAHYIFQVQRNEDRRLFRIEAFYKKYEDLVKTRTADYQTYVAENSGSGFAKGLEMLWRDRKTFKNIDYWISYSYLDSKREFMNYPVALFPSFAAKHNISFVAKKFVTQWKTGFNMSYTYTSGRPFYNIISTGNENTLLGMGKVKDYNSLNFSVNYLPNLGRKEAKSFTILVAGISNVLGFKNVYSYRFSQDGMRSAAVLPAANTFFYVGAMFSFGIDKTQEAIDNNL